MKKNQIKLGSKVWYRNPYSNKAKGIVVAYGPRMCLVEHDGWAEEYHPCRISQLTFREE